MTILDWLVREGFSEELSFNLNGTRHDEEIGMRQVQKAKARTRIHRFVSVKEMSFGFSHCVTRKTLENLNIGVRLSNLC